MLVVKSCVELLRSCGINILVVFSDIPEFCLDYKLPTTKNIRTRNNKLFLILIAVQISLVIQGLDNCFILLLDKVLKGACLLSVLLNLL